MRYTNIFILIIITFSTLVFSFIFKFDISGGGSSSDIYTHWDFIKKLNLDLNNLFLMKSGEDYKLLHFPLHHIFFSQFDFFSENLENYLSFFFIFSFILPILFYLNCVVIFKDIDKKNIIIISLLTCLLPHYQASAIWGNSHITALSFFLSSILFLNLGLTNNEIQKKHIFFCLLFMTFAAYTRQYYIIFFPFLLFKIYVKQRFSNVIFISLSLILLSSPGIYYLINNPNLLFGLKMEITDLKSSIVIVFSIISFYLIPFFILDFKRNIKIIKDNLSKKNIYSHIVLYLCLLFLCFNFFYDSTIGGGIFFKLSLIVFDNNLVLFISSFIGLFLIIFYTHKNNDVLFLIFLISISFSSGFYVFQKYFEPLIYFIFFLLFDLTKVKLILKKNLNFLIFYYSAYWLIYFLYGSGQIIVN